MRVIPIDFPCGCVCSREFWDGRPTLFTRFCDAHWKHHEHDEEIGDVVTITCDCPACEFSRWAGEHPTREGNYEAENWKFLAGLAARRRLETA